MAVVHVTGDTFEQEVFEQEVLKAEGKVLVDFWAAWCGPCQMQGPVLDEIAQEYDNVKIGKVNVDEEQALALHYGITSIPTLMVFKDGEVSDTLVGLRSKEEMLKVLGI